MSIWEGNVSVTVFLRFTLQVVHFSGGWTASNDTHISRVQT